MFEKRLGKSRTPFNVTSHFLDDFLEGRVLLLVAENLQALNQRQARINHRRELPREDDEILGYDLLFQETNVFRNVLRLGLNRNRRKHLPAKRGHDGFFVRRLHDALRHGSMSRLTLPGIDRHCPSPPPVIFDQLLPAAHCAYLFVPPFSMRFRSSSTSGLLPIASSSETIRLLTSEASD